MRRMMGRLVVAGGVAALAFAGSVAAAAQGGAPLVTAAAEQDGAAVRTLLDAGADVNAARADGATALLYASHWDDLETAELLLRAGARVNAADDHGVTPLARACENVSMRMVETLLDAGADPNAAQTSGLTPLMTAVRTGSVELVRTLLARGADVNAATVETHGTPLMWAVAGQRMDLVHRLVERGADVHVSTAKGFTLLMMAARNGDIEMARTLLAAGADVNVLGADGTHVLPFAIVLGQAEFAYFLLEQGADPNATVAGVSALHAATGHMVFWLAEWHQKHGASSRAPGLTPAERPPLVKALLDRGADPNARIAASAVFEDYLGYPRRGAFDTYASGLGDPRGATPLWIAAHGANGRPIFTVSMATGCAGGCPGGDESAGLVEMLLAAGADPLLTSDDGTTPLMVAAGLGRYTNDKNLRRGELKPSAEKAVRLLLAAGSDINARNEADFTALHGAALRGSHEVIQILVDYGADLNARDFRGRTPYRLAEGSKQAFYFQEFPETAAFLESLGADTTLGLKGTVQERLRDAPAAAAVAEQQQQEQ